MLSRINLGAINLWKMNKIRYLNMGVASRALKTSMSNDEKGESARMKDFHDKLNSGAGPSVQFGGMRLDDDIVLVELDSKTGELIANSEKEPTKWGDWQNGGRVSDF